MHCNGAIRNMIRESKIHQIDNAINSFGNEGMISMDSYLLELYGKKIISEETAVKFSFNSGRVDITKCPVSAAVIAVFIVSKSRISPTRITSGDCLKLHNSLSLQLKESWFPLLR